MASEVIKDKINDAIKLVKDVPEMYRDGAFQVVLKHILDSDGPSHERVLKKPTKAPVAVGKGDINAILRSDYDWTSTQIPKLKPIGQNLFILKIASDEFGMDALSPRDIQLILSQKFRLSKSANAVSMSLMEAVGRYVDRIQEGKEYLYRITNTGRNHLGELIKQLGERHK